jgi:hypothetical protein
LAGRLSRDSEIDRRNKGNGDAKYSGALEWSRKILDKEASFRFHRQLDGLRGHIRQELPVYLQKACDTRGTEVMSTKT